MRRSTLAIAVAACQGSTRIKAASTSGGFFCYQQMEMGKDNLVASNGLI